MTIDLHRQPWHFPPLEFAGVPITEESYLKLLVVTFDSQLSYRRHLRAVTARANQRLGLLRNVSPLLDPCSRQIVYCEFVRPVMEYCPRVWMGAADWHLRRLDQAQRSALLIGHGALLQGLSIRRVVAACVSADLDPSRFWIPYDVTHCLGMRSSLKCRKVTYKMCVAHPRKWIRFLLASTVLVDLDGQNLRFC